MGVKSILQTNDLAEVLGAARLEMADNLGDGPYIIEFTEESNEGQSQQIRELPDGGLVGQVLAKKSNSDYDVEWIDVADGGGIAGVSSFNGRSGAITPQNGDYTAEMVGAVPTTRTVNGKALDKDITLTSVESASKLQTARTIRTNLASTVAASFDGSQNVLPGVQGVLPVANGGTGQNSLTSGYALIGNGTNAVGLRAITNNTSATASIAGSQNLVTMNTIRYALNRETGIRANDTNYITPMVRAIYAGTGSYTPGVTQMTNGVIYLRYE